jgi:hypothetical protein
MGEAVRPHLQKLFAEAKKTVEAAEKVDATPDVAKATPKVAEPSKGKVESTSTLAKQRQAQLKEKGIETDITREQSSNEALSNEALDYVLANPAEAEKIALSGINTTNIDTELMAGHLFNWLIKSGLTERAMKVGEASDARLTERGQATSALQELIDPHSAFGAFRILKTAKTERAASKTPTRGKKKSAKKQVSERVKAEVSALKNATKNARMNIEELMTFIEKRKCK